MLSKKCSCGYKAEDGENLKICEKKESCKSREIEVVDTENDEKTLPETTAECHKCGCTKAYFWEVQTRAADEPPTKFLKCTKCKHTWRDYS